jgi:hypothetical protein
VAEWQKARLIPVSGIDSEKEAETRATSALLAVLAAVRPFSKALLDDLGSSRASSAVVETFTECQFDHDGRRVRPDGLIRVQHGTKPAWTALVEVKTGENQLEAEQLNMYWDIARSEGFQAVISISSEIVPASGVHPTPGLKVRANARVPVHHFSWARILTEAIMQKVHRGVDDPDQAWILGELIRYLQHPASGALQFRDMGPAWVDVRSAARNGSLRRKDPRALEIADRWQQLLRFAALRLGAEIGQAVEVVLPNGRRVDAQRSGVLASSLAETGVLDGALRVPDTAGLIEVSADVRAQLLAACLAIDAPRDKGARGRVSWLVAQLAGGPDQLVIESWAKNARAATASGTLAAVREDRGLLLGPDGKEPARYRLVLRSPMGTSRKAAGRAQSFVDSVLSLLDAFYESVVQNLSAWQPRAPRRQSIEEPNAPADESAADARPEAHSDVSSDDSAAKVPAV